VKHSSHRSTTTLCLLLSLLSLPLRVEAGQEAAPCLLQSSLVRLQKTAGRVGVQVVAIPSGRVLFAHRAQETFVPASVVKLFTSYGALKQLSPQHRFSTTLWVREKPQGSVIPGDLWLRSEGDPFLLADRMSSLARQLRDSGIKGVQGGIYADNSYFEPQTEQICLDGNCQDAYNPVLSATSMDFNTIVFQLRPAPKTGGPVQVEWFPRGDYVSLNNLATTSSRSPQTPLKVQSLGMTQDGRERYRITGKLPMGSGSSQDYRVNIQDPGAFVARSLRAVLQESGIQVVGKAVRRGTVPAGATILVSTESPPLAEMIHGLNRYSNNFMAEMLLRSLGGCGLGPPGTAAKGLAVLGKTLREIDIPEREVQLHSGSGLSRRCLASPQAFCRVLLKAYGDPSVGREFFASLAVNGQEGTLRNRLVRTDTAIRGKTGTLNDVVAFSGYVADPTGELCAVTILLNQVTNLVEAREALDSFLEDVAALGTKGMRAD
jgi:serine-type D-Ala-D-Ala carboxypeptidase/endopeptidase (penicillin-binding protein 4)